MLTLRAKHSYKLGSNDLINVSAFAAEGTASLKKNEGTDRCINQYKKKEAKEKLRGRKDDTLGVVPLSGTPS